jgi:hypothetical protein
MRNRDLRCQLATLAASLLAFSVLLAVIPSSYPLWSKTLRAAGIVNIGEFTPTPSVPGRPSPELIPDDAFVDQPCGGPYELELDVHNSADDARDIAKNVEVTFSALRNGQYVAGVLFSNGDSWDPAIQDSYLWHVGDIGPLGTATITYTTEVMPETPDEAEIRLLIEITREDARPEHNQGRLAHATIEHCVSSPTTADPTPEAVDGADDTAGATATAEPTETPAPSETPGSVETPTPTGTPVASETSTPTGTPAAGETPTPTGTPAAGETPTPTGTPAAGETPTPTSTPGSVETPTPTATPTPGE